MGIKFLALIFLFLLVAPMANAQELKIVYVQGKCEEYEIKVRAYGVDKGCYDLKIDSPEGRVGEIYDPDEGWKSSYYYLRDGYCTGQENVYKFRAKTYEDFEIEVKIKDGSKTIKSEYKKIDQECPTLEEEPAMFFLASLTAVMIILAGIALYVKKLD